MRGSAYAQSRWVHGRSCQRYASDYRLRGAWALFRHEMSHGLLIEGSVHHLDQLRNHCGADCATIAGWDWNPGHVRGNTAAWRSSDSFDGEACALLVLRMTNGSFASYEGNNQATGKTNSWHGEYYRIECEGGVAVLDRDHIVRIEERSAAGTLQTREVPLVEVTGRATSRSRPSSWTGSTAVPPPATTLNDNLQSTAMLFAAVQASETGATVIVQEMVRQVSGLA